MTNIKNFLNHCNKIYSEFSGTREHSEKEAGHGRSDSLIDFISEQFQLGKSVVGKSDLVKSW